MPAAKSMNNIASKGRYTAILALKIFVSVSLLAYLFTKLDFSSLSKLDIDIAYYTILSAFVMLIALWLMTLRWRIVLKLIETKKYLLKSLYGYYLIGSFFNIFIPGAIGGDAMRLYYVSKYYNISKTKSLLAVFIERVAGLLALGIILMFSLLFNNTVRERLGYNFWLITLTLATIALALIAAKYFIQKKMEIRYKEILVILLLSGLGQFGDIVIAYIYSLYFGLEISLLSLMTIMPLVYVATVIPISLGGVGVREGVMTAGMALYGVDVSEAVMVSFLLYITKVLVGFAGWILYLKIGKMNDQKA
ncbi:MAG: flippase-like domain-containing protein [Hydrogenimonas sp.]|nr:flippase-like domain-containing protein [Hydrogenimonas sp.]